MESVECADNYCHRRASKIVENGWRNPIRVCKHHAFMRMQKKGEVRHPVDSVAIVEEWKHEM